MTSAPWVAQYSAWVAPMLSPEHGTALAGFRAQCAARPDEPALRYFDATLSWAELAREVDRVAAGLGARGVRQGDRVAIGLQNVPQFPIALLAAWRLGAIGVPINPMLRARETHALLADAGCTALVTGGDFWEDVGREAVKESPVTLVVATHELDCVAEPSAEDRARFPARGRCPDAIDWAELRRDTSPPGIADVAPGDTALLTYTSGTTGPPKGAMNTHGNVAFSASVYCRWARLGPGDPILAAAPLFHITGTVAHLGVWLFSGAPLLLFHRFEAGLALRTIERWRASFTVASITAFLALMNHPDLATRDLSSFRKVFSGGAPIAPAVVERFRRLTGAYIHNVYGMTETTSPTHMVPLDREAPVDPGTGALAVGVPVPATACAVVDPESGRDLGPGELGELCVAGPQVVPGYWRNDSATREAFRDGRLRTGDVGTMDAAGWFYVVDRLKDQINVSGFKVWPREVEDVLYRHPAVREAVVVGVPDAYRGETVKAFVTLTAGGEATAGELIALTRRELAAYKCPRLVEIVDELPRTATGKFLRRELRARARPA
jgi:long-chain acyl-CoA synthetase